MTCTNPAFEAHSAPKLRVCFIDRLENQSNHRKAIVEGLSVVFDLTVRVLEEGWPKSLDDIDDAKSFDAIIWKPKFSELMRRPAFDWKDYAGLRVLYDLDSVQNYSTIVGTAGWGCWPTTYARHNFNLFIGTGREICRRLCEDGVEARWVPKGFDAKRIRPFGGERKEPVCYYGSEYAPRRRMLKFLAKRGYSIGRIDCEFTDLPLHLGQYLSCLICNMEFAGCGIIPNSILTRLPLWMRIERVGLEPMIKNFESAGAGCAPICDHIPELESLGFVDGETMISYSTFDELVARLDYYLPRPDELARIGRNAAILAHHRHSWLDRAHQIDHILRTVLTT